MKRRLATAAILACLSLAMTACAGGLTSLDPKRNPMGKSGGLVVGTANFSENVILGHLYAGALRAKGITATVKQNLGSREIIVPALKQGDIDVLPEYQGSLLQFLDKNARQSAAEDVQQALERTVPQGVKVLPYAAAENKDVYVVTRETADRYGLKTLEDLRTHAKDLIFGGPAEDKTRYVGLVGLKELYGAEFKDFKALDTGGPLTRGALRGGDIQVANLFSTDVTITNNNWVILDDPKKLVPAQHIVPLVNEAKASTTVTEALAALNTKLTTEELSKLDAKVDNDKEDPDRVAKAWLEQHGLGSQ
ncbi:MULTISPECIES: ABC transporter substrate-binding protein [unclassified Crossiella]|uniref:ABC transporter substrate-binding protein n=1 Tax=unclassified Crossiella TaxID=2620835 RepID=UPI001FFE5135|nr:MULTISPECIES: ABC transporter substrate-binding protein [unclassified Crossiella]MCK2244520.1 ABC transporter substrate-binding protein [Crossiella sp. S99.2]MCK2258151.1 ABC transporter substrate-binding protein [Crossiella sp. S99.1]